MKKILLIILLPLFLFSQEIITNSDGQKLLLNPDGSWEYIYSHKIQNTTWKVYWDDGDEKTITFESDGTFKYINDKTQYGNEGKSYDDIRDTWKIVERDIVIISFTDGYSVWRGNLISYDNYIVGTYKSDYGLSGTWFGIKQNNTYEY
tara:strand:+ start:90 stop:533 length:444 start_codon:yes stop_codon:yes gene_type:complete